MSKYHMNKVLCPKCGQEIEIKIWDSINIDMNPELKEKILEGTIYDISCCNCKTEIHCVYGFLYHDLTGKYMIGVQHDYSSALKEFPVPKGYKFRKVLDLNHLIEKIRIFDEGYNDIALELAKKMTKKIGGYEKELLFCTVEKDNILFALPSDQGKVLQVPTRIYDISYDGCTENDLKEKERFVVVDEKYILNLMKDSCQG